jgi:predicted heme/steroid binding protein
MREFTIEELMLCNGIDSPELCVALDGKVTHQKRLHYSNGVYRFAICVPPLAGL